MDIQPSRVPDVSVDTIIGTRVHGDETSGLFFIYLFVNVSDSFHLECPYLCVFFCVLTPL